MKSALATDLYQLTMMAAYYELRMEREAVFEFFVRRMNASLFLGGLGPLVPPDTTGGKLFVGVFSLYSGLVFVVVITIVVAPVLHRVLHRFHWDEKD